MRRIALTALTVAAAIAGGCRTTPQGKVSITGREVGILPSRGRTTELFRAPLADVASATREALADLSIELPTPTPSGGKVDAGLARAGGPQAGAVTMQGKTADGRPVVVDLRPASAGTVVGIRIGTGSGDLPFAMTIVDRVGVRLGTRPPEPIPDLPPIPTPVPLFSKQSIPDSEMFGDQGRSHYRDSPVPY